METIRSLSICLVLLNLFLKEVRSQEIQRCTYQTQGDENRGLQFTDKLWTIQTSEYNIFYTLCGFVPYNLGQHEAAACLTSKKAKESEICSKLGSRFVIDSKNGDPILRSVNGTRCPHSTNQNYSIIINFKCADEIPEQPSLVQNNDKCVFEIDMLHPSCKPKCTYRILDNFIDLRPFNGSRLIATDNDTKYAISLCGPALECGHSKNYSVCKISNGTVEPLATYESLGMSYKDRRESIFIHGDIADGKAGTKSVLFKLYFKCNWETFKKNLHFIKKSTQTVYYDFEIESSIGCIVKHEPCVITNSFYIYNLSKLYDNHNEKWTVQNYNKTRNLWLNICGPLNLVDPIFSKCTDTHAQVCENANGVFTNKGSVFTELQLDGDVIVATFEDGMRCNETTAQNYRTVINFHCNEVETGPYFDRINGCDTFIKWRTPEACPQFVPSACATTHSEYKECKIKHNDKLYDLSPLTLHGNKTLVINNGTKEFLINICGPIFDEDAPCMTDVNVAMKDLKQFNKRYRVTSLGKLNQMSFSNGHIIFEYRGGTFSVEDFQDYRSQIIFTCSETEEKPILWEQSSYNYTFLWRTKYACSNGNDNLVKRCPILDVGSDKKVDIDNNLRTKVDVKTGDHQISFDICDDNYTMCTSDDNCNNHFYTTKIMDLPYLKLLLPKDCQSPDDFNKTEILFECDPLINNSHFVNFTNSDCTLRFKYVSDRTCALLKNIKSTTPVEREVLEETTTTRQNQENESKKTFRPIQPEPIHIVSDCAIPSNVTSYQFSLSILKLNFTKKCPFVTSFSNKSLLIELRYQTEDKCENKTNNKASTYYYKIVLRCVKGEATELKETHRDQCFDRYQYDRFEFCNFFNLSTVESKNTQTAGISVTGISFGVISVIVAMVGVGVGVYRRWGFRCWSKHPEYCNVYFKLE